MFLQMVSRNHVYFQTILLCIWGPKLYLSFSCFRTVVKKSSLLRETSCHASLYPAHIQYHPIKCKVQKHFKSYVKLHFIFHQAFWMATLLMDSNNSLTSLLEQKRALKKSKLQHPYRLARWQFDLPWNFKSFACAGAGGLLVVNNQSFKHHETCCFAEKAHRNCFFEGHDFNRMGASSSQHLLNGFQRHVGYGWSTSQLGQMTKCVSLFSEKSRWTTKYRNKQITCGHRQL